MIATMRSAPHTPSRSSAAVCTSRQLPNTNRQIDESHMSEALISDICKCNGGYRTPELNEKLYLHFRGFRKIEGLDAFVNTKVLWLENNLIGEIEGLGALAVLDSLYLQHNQIHRLPQCSPLVIPSLRSLNLSHNHLTSLDGIETCFPNLEKLLAAHNHLECIGAIQSLPHLSILDVSHNKLSGNSDGIRGILRRLNSLASLMIHGNDFVKNVKHYRKVMIEENAALKFLDEYPVFDDERRCAVAFVRRGGIEAEKAERDKIREEERQRQESQRKFFSDLVEAAKKQRGVDPLPPTSYFQQNDDDDDVFVPSTSASSADARRSRTADSRNDSDLALSPATDVSAPREQQKLSVKRDQQTGRRSQMRRTQHVDPLSTLSAREQQNAAVAAPSAAADLFCVTEEDDILSLFRLDGDTQAAIQKAVLAVPHV